MSEIVLIEDIKRKRREAIDRSDKKYAKQLLDPKISRTTLTIILAILALYLILSTVMIFREPPQVTNSIQEVTYITQIQNVTEHIIKGDKLMTCLEFPNSTKVDCYKEKP
ncbi:unnamed protein product [marine sediment metagenome]|uniref:Uncharacterized protein n=1 Tax=marine sediment metagenome TaxID=412755 RepID=X0UCP4_9ZZZZ